MKSGKGLKKNIWRGAGLQKKIIVLYVLTSILPILLISLLSFYFYYQGMLKEVLNFVEETSEGHELVVDNRLESYIEKMYEIVTDSDIIRASESVNSDDEKKSFTARWKINEELSNYISALDKIRGLMFIAENDEYVSVFQGVGSVRNSVFSEETVRKELQEKVEGANEITYITGIDFAMEETRSDHVIMLGFPVRNLRTSERLGVMIMALEDSILNFDNGKRSEAVGYHRRAGVTTLITNAEDVIVAADEEAYIGRNYQEYLAEEIPDDNRIHEIRSDFSMMKCQIINLVDMDIYLQNIYALAKMIAGITICITLVFLVLLYAISKKYIGSVQKIEKGIEKYSGTPGENLQVDIDDKDELYLIARQFNEMIQRVNHLVSTLQKKNEEIKEVMDKQKHAEIKALEAQINPHFLFNTLDSINWRAIEHGEEEISNMLSSLGSLLRYSISNIECIVLLEAEVAWLRKYVYLQRERFHHSFDCIFDIEEESLSFPIYKMLLQPLIENIILHGFDGVKEGGMIFVQSYVQEDDRLFLRIQDNGSGIPEDRLAAIQADIKGGESFNSRSIGINNVINRLKVYYQEEVEFGITSQQGEGTEVWIVIPRLEA